MRVLYLLSKILQVTAIPYALKAMGHEVGVYPHMLEDIDESDTVKEEFDSFVRRNSLDLVISTSFCTHAAECTHRYGVKYAVYGMDSPQFELWKPQAKYDNVYLFQFDSRECQVLRENGYHNVWYMPLAIRDTGKVTVTGRDRDQYGAEVSFVGSVYTHNPFDELRGWITKEMEETAIGMMESAAFLWDGTDRITETFSKTDDPGWMRLAAELRRAYIGIEEDIPDVYLLKHFVLDRKLTNLERSMILELLAENYDFRLYTRDGEIVSPRIRRFGEVDSDSEALKVFGASRINLNLTLRSIEAGLPLRIFDIMSMAGFVLTDYREDAAELFQEGRELVMYRTPEEMLEKIDYYLRHETERMQIGINARARVEADFTYEKQLGRIMKILSGPQSR